MSDDRAQTRIAGLTDIGLRRAHNEDHIDFDEGQGILVLADGMGGHKAGERAAHMAVNLVLESLQNLIDRQTLGSISSTQLLTMISDTISDSNRRIYQAASADHDLKGMGTTLVAAIVRGSRVYIGHVGDSRLYLFRNNFLTRITRDHSLMQELIDKGLYTEAEARTATIGHIVTRALGIKAEVEVDAAHHELENNDLILLCSDGLTDMVADTLLQIALKDSQDVDLMANRLVELANEHGGKDNISVILARVCLEGSDGVDSDAQ